jgi:hypothetical protein
LQAFPPFCTELDPQHLDQVITNLMQLSCIRPRFGVVPRPVNGVVPNAFKPLYLPYIWMIVSDDASSFLNPRSWTSWRGQRVFLWNLRAPFISSSNGSLLLPFDDSKTSRAAQGGGGGFKDSFFLESLVVVTHGWQSEPTDGPKGG